MRKGPSGSAIIEGNILLMSADIYVDLFDIKTGKQPLSGAIKTKSYVHHFESIGHGQVICFEHRGWVEVIDVTTKKVTFSLHFKS